MYVEADMIKEEPRFEESTVYVKSECADEDISKYGVETEEMGYQYQNNKILGNTIKKESGDDTDEEMWETKINTKKEEIVLEVKEESSSDDKGEDSLPEIKTEEIMLKMDFEDNDSETGEAIWDKKNRSHHNSLLLTKLWKEIAIECDTTVTLAKAQWKRLRESFKKKLLEMPVNHSGDGVEDDDGEKPHWQYFDSLLFLKDQCVPRHSTGNFEMSNIEDTEDSEEASALNSMDEVLSDIDSQPTTPASSSLTPQHKTSVDPILKKARTQKTAKTTDAVGEALLKAEQEKIAYLKRKEENRGKREEKELDEDEAFFKSILPHVRAMNPKQKMAFRIRVLQLIDNEIPTQSSMQYVPQRFPSTYYVDRSQSGSVTSGSTGYDNQQGQQAFPQQIPFQSGSNVEPGMAINQGGSGENVQSLLSFQTYTKL